MARPRALLMMGGYPIHHADDHYELLAGLFAGPLGCNVTVTDDFPGQTAASLAGYDLLALWSTLDEPPREPVDALFEAVDRGTPLLGLHAAPYTVRKIPGAPQAIGSLFAENHLPYQEFPVTIAIRDHPITSGVDDFTIRDEPYCLDVLGDGVDVLVTFDGRLATGQWPTVRPHHERVHAWRNDHPRAPLAYTKQLGRGRIYVNALGHDRAALTHPAYRRLMTQGARWLLDQA